MEKFLTGRHPADYWRALPPDRQLRVYARIRRAYADSWISRDLIGDCAQQACLLIMKYAHDLLTGPTPDFTHSREWQELAENALVNFAKGHMKKIVLNTINKQHYSPVPCEVQHDQEDDSSNVGKKEEATSSHQRQCEYVKALKAVLTTKGNERAILVLDLLGRIIDGLEPAASEESAFRGETFQINNSVLLDALRRNHSEFTWEIDDVRRAVADLRRYATQLETKFAQDGLFLFGTSRPSKVEEKGEMRARPEGIAKPEAKLPKKGEAS